MALSQAALDALTDPAWDRRPHSWRVNATQEATMYRDFASGKMVAEPGDPPALDDAAVGNMVGERVAAFCEGLSDALRLRAGWEYGDPRALIVGLAVAYGTALINKEADQHG